MSEGEPRLSHESESTGKPEGNTKPSRFNANFSGEAYDILAGLAHKRGTTIPEVLSDAIAFEQWFDELHRTGGRLLVERHGQFTELVRSNTTEDK